MFVTEFKSNNNLKLETKRYLACLVGTVAAGMEHGTGNEHFDTLTSYFVFRLPSFTANSS